MLKVPDKRWTVSRAHADDLVIIWPQIQPEIARGLRRGAGDTITERGLFSGVLKGEVDLWVIHEGLEVIGAVFLRIEDRAKGAALVVLDAVGRNGCAVELTKEMLPRLREYAEMIGAYTIEGVARPGAARILTRLGCKPKAVIMEMGDGRQST